MKLEFWELVLLDDALDIRINKSKEVKKRLPDDNELHEIIDENIENLNSIKDKIRAEMDI